MLPPSPLSTAPWGVVAYSQDLKDEIELLKERLKGTMKQCSALLKDKSKMKDQLKAMDRSLRSLAKSAEAEGKRCVSPAPTCAALLRK